MLRVNGLYGHVAKNNLRSLWVFSGFAVAFQIIAAVLVLPYLLFFDTDHLFFAFPFEYMAKYGLPMFVFSVVYYGLTFYLYLHTIERELGFAEAKGQDYQRLRQIVEPIAITAGVPMPELAIIETDARNAFASGWRESHSKLVVTRGLLNALNNDELAAVMAHEIVHVKNGDVRLMAFANVAIACVKALEKVNLFRVRSGKRFLLLLIVPPLAIVVLMLSVFVNFCMHIGTSIAKISRLVIASSREFIADAEAVRLTHNSAALISALMKIEGRSTIEGLDPTSEAMMIDGAAIGEWATHPTISERIDTLRKHTGSMAVLSGHAVNSLTEFRATYGSQNFSGANRQPSFGKRTQFANNNPQTMKSGPSNVYQRITADSKRSVTGLPKNAMRYLRWGLIIFLALNLFSVWMVRQQFTGGNSAGQFKHISSELSVRKEKDDASVPLN